MCRPIIADIDAVWLQDPLKWLDIDNEIGRENLFNKISDTSNDDFDDTNYRKSDDDDDNYNTDNGNDSIFKKYNVGYKDEFESRIIQYRGTPQGENVHGEYVHGENVHGEYVHLGNVHGENVHGGNVQNEVDVYITDDNGEICGCFIALR